MTKSSPKPPHMPWISAYLIVQNVQKALDFYCKAFGFSESDEKVFDDNQLLVHTALTYRDTLVMIGSKQCVVEEKGLAPISSGVNCPIGLYVYCENVDELYKQALANGAQSVSKPELTFWGDKMCRLLDLDHYCWSFATWQQQ